MEKEENKSNRKSSEGRFIAINNW